MLVSRQSNIMNRPAYILCLSLEGSSIQTGCICIVNLGGHILEVTDRHLLITIWYRVSMNSYNLLIHHSQ